MPTVKADGHAAASIDELPSLYDGLIKLARTELALASGPDGLRVLCVGSVPGGAYTPPEWTG